MKTMKWIKSLLSIDIDEPSSSKIYKTREGRAILIDDAFKAWTTSDLSQMLKAVATDTHLIDRHFLLQRVVRETYKLRKDSYYSDLCLEHAQLHFVEFEDIAPILKDDLGGTLPRIATFQQHATVLAELGEFARANEACECAVQRNLHDGTKSGFKGRIARLKKQRDKARQ